MVPGGGAESARLEQDSTPLDLKGWITVKNFRVFHKLWYSLAAVLLASALFSPVYAQPQSSAQQVLGQADEVFRQMSDITGLPIKAPLKKQIVSRAGVEKYLQEDLHSEMTPQEMHIRESTLRAFGLVGPDFDLEKFLIRFYTEQAAGFYDPGCKTMFIADWTEPEMQRLTLAHELTHALQDQNFELEKYLKGAPSDDDASNARLAVVEGQATAAMIQQMVAPMKLAEMPQIQPLMAQLIHQQYAGFPYFNEAPYFLRVQAMFPYIEGLGFIQRALQEGGWKRLNQLFTDPPKTTREIYDPQAYLERDAPWKISLPHPAPLDGIPGLTFLAENSLGELGYYEVIGQLVSEAEAKAVAGDWRADRYLLYERATAADSASTPGGTKCVLVSRTRWSRPESALAFFRDYQGILPRKFPGLSKDSRTTADVFIGTTANGGVILLRKGDECRWAEGIPAPQFEAILSWLLSL
jgi:hypothetical protein